MKLNTKREGAKKRVLGFAIMFKSNDSDKLHRQATPFDAVGSAIKLYNLDSEELGY